MATSEKIEEFIRKYIKELEDAIAEYKENGGYSQRNENLLYEHVRKIAVVLKKYVPDLDDDLKFMAGYCREDANILIDKLKFFLLEESSLKEKENDKVCVESTPKIFLSHKSNDKKYADALRDFIIGLGVKNNQLIYTSHPLHKIPLDENIYEYLRRNINNKVFMIILWSDEYLESPACLNEMGAAWVVKNDYTNIYVPTFSFDNPKYHQCAVDTDKMGAILNGGEHCKANMLELKEKIENLFGLKKGDKETMYLLDQFIKAITTEESNVVEF